MLRWMFSRLFEVIPGTCFGITKLHITPIPWQRIFAGVKRPHAVGGGVVSLETRYLRATNANSFSCIVLYSWRGLVGAQQWVQEWNY